MSNPLYIFLLIGDGLLEVRRTYDEIAHLKEHWEQQGLPCNIAKYKLL